ncbi:MAG: hypothetical protein GY708_29940 [Actinomycetia bacterium]|nr:hypothetical protein [Actinomycetes bacterium]MCP4963353.1 hypothetical protein [Actinomycetes bacterium]
MEVSRVPWPGGGDLRRQLTASGKPRLLVVAEDSAPPLVSDPLEDWVRMPAREDDIEARARTLARRAEKANAPSIDDDGVLSFDGYQMALPPVEARLAGHLVNRLGAVASRTDLARAGWPGGIPTRNALDVRILRLRRRVEPRGLVIRTVRHRGYLMEAAKRI